jgi:GNAT superfamily N-acetyltransferase
MLIAFSFSGAGKSPLTSSYMIDREFTFDVFGRVVIVRRESQGWVVFEAGADGKRGLSEGIRIPPFIEAKRLGEYLADLCHESATPERSEVKLLAASAEATRDEYCIVSSLVEHLPTLARIELKAAQMFSKDVLPEPMRSSCTEDAALRKGHEDGLLWIALDVDAQPVGFLLAKEIDSCLHIKEMSVDPAHARRGLGSRLVQAVIDAAIDRGFAGLTLTTFKNVPWNGPFYEKMGFSVVDSASMGDAMAETLRREANLGLQGRVGMYRPAVSSV